MSPPQQDPSEVLEIRRYSNRRFYDPSRSRHVTLEEIRNLVREGRDVRITDASTGDDITSRTLTQIILEYDDRKIAALPAAMLHRLIRSSESLFIDFMKQYFDNAARLFDPQQAAEEQWRRMTGGTATPQAMANWWQSAWGGMPPPWLNPAAPEPETPAETPAEAPPEGNELRRVIEDLREQLQSVQSDLETLRQDESTNGPARPKGRPPGKKSR